VDTKTKCGKTVRGWTRTVPALLAALALAACAGIGEGPASGEGGFGGGGGGGGGSNGTLVLFAEDQLPKNVLAYELTVSDLTLRNTAGGLVDVLPSAVELEWRSRAVGPTVLSITSVPANSYDRITVTLTAPPDLIVFEPSNSSFNSLTPALASGATLTVNIPITLTVTAGQTSGARLDLDLRNSLTLDVLNNLVFTPIFAFVPTSFVVGQLPGDIDDVLGTVSDINTATNSFRFTVQSSGASFVVNTDANTRFEVIGGVANLISADRVELDARLQSDGTFLAQEVERETPTSEQQIRGLVISSTRAVGLLTSMNILVLDAAPTSGVGTACAVPVPARAICTVAVDALTTFRISSEDLPLISFPNTDFDRTALGVGQFVHVVKRSGVGFTADAATLEEIALVGQVGATVGGSSFDFIPDGDFFSVNGLGNITVLTNSASELEDMPAGLGSLNPNQSIVSVRGVLVFNAGNGQLVLKRARLLQP